jgi:hypothetical protein
MVLLMCWLAADMCAQASIHDKIIDGYAKDALRVLLLAYRDFDSEQDWEDDDALAQHMTLLAIVGIQVCDVSVYGWVAG